jgi:hypothetical protein
MKWKSFEFYANEGDIRTKKLNTILPRYCSLLDIWYWLHNVEVEQTYTLGHPFPRWRVTKIIKD